MHPLHRGRPRLQEQYSLVVWEQSVHFSRRYSVFTVLKHRLLGFHFPSFTPFRFCSCSVFLLSLATIGDGTTTPLSPILLVSMHFASCFLKSSDGSAFSFLARARTCTAFASATDNRNVNCRFGHHFVAQISSKAIGSWRRLFTSSTQCFARLCLLNGSAYLNVFHSPPTNRHVEWSWISSRTPCVDNIFVT